MRVHQSRCVIEARADPIGFFVAFLWRFWLRFDLSGGWGATSASSCSTSKGCADLIPSTEEDMEPAVPAKDAIEGSPSLPNNLCR